MSEDARLLTSARIEQLPEVLARHWSPDYYPVAVAGFLTLTEKSMALMKITSPKLHTSHLIANDEAVDWCRRALELKDKGSYRRAQDVMSPLWERVGERPRLTGLHPSVAAEVLMCVGILTRWIGSKNQFKAGQEFGKDLISESITYYQSVGDVKMIAAGRVELALARRLFE